MRIGGRGRGVGVGRGIGRGEGERRLECRYLIMLSRSIKLDALEVGSKHWGQGGRGGQDVTVADPYKVPKCWVLIVQRLLPSL